MKIIFSLFLLLTTFLFNAVFCMDPDGMNEEDIRTLTGYMDAGMSFEDAVEAIKENRNFSSRVNADERDARLGDTEMAIVMQLMETGMSFEEAAEATRKGRNSSSAAAAFAQEEGKMDSETAALIARLEAENYPQPIQYQEDSVFHTVRNHRDIAAHRTTLAPLVTYLRSIPQGADVHTMDAHVAANITKLSIIGDAFGVDNPNLSIANIQTYLNQFTASYTGYEGQAVSSTELQGYITAALNTASRDKTTIGLYSRIISILQYLQNEIIEEDFYAHLKHLFDAIAENYKTRGGCFEGVRNRAYISYVSTLNVLMGQ